MRCRGMGSRGESGAARRGACGPYRASWFLSLAPPLSLSLPHSRSLSLALLLSLPLSCSLSLSLSLSLLLSLSLSLALSLSLSLSGDSVLPLAPLSACNCSATPREPVHQNTYPASTRCLCCGRHWLQHALQSSSATVRIRETQNPPLTRAQLLRRRERRFRR
jgi:hypothetical protein